MYITAPCFEAEKYITGRKKYITALCFEAEKYITARKKYLTARKTWQIYLTGPFGLYRRAQPPYRAGKDLLNWWSLRIF